MTKNPGYYTKAPKGDIDVFLEPLYDELKELWIGVSAYDMHLKEKFNFRAMLMWGIHDFPAYGNLAGCVTHGYKACPICGDDAPSIYLKSSRKNVYLDYRIFLRGNHPIRKGKYLGLVGSKKEELRTPPQRLNGDELLQTLSNVKYIPGQKRKRVHEVTSAWYRKSIFFDLPYWIHHQVRHVIDVMHTEKNVAAHILDTILSKKDKSKDTIQGREDMRELGIHRDQWMQTDAASGKQVKPIAPFCLNKAEKMDFLKTLKNLRLPSGFSSNLSNIVSLDPPGLLVMKSHDYHVIMQYLLPVLLQHAFPTHPELRRALHQISLFFNLLCSKVVSRREIQDAKYMVVEALCVLEKKYFPVSFFDISIHLIMHLADEALMCGPSHTLWMYPFERSMKECKDIPSNKRYVEGSIAESYLLRESVRYAMEYIPDSQHKTTGLDFLMKMMNMKDLCLKVKMLFCRMSNLFKFVDGYFSVWKSMDLTITTGYRESLQSRKGKGIAKTEVEIQTDFINWLYTKLLKNGDTKHDLWFFARGPLFLCKSFRKYRINGYVFSTKSHDETVLTQDCGVCMNAITTFTSSRKDKNPIDASAMWYGVIKQILEVNYNNFKEVVFYCNWVRVEDKANGCKLCPDSNLVVVNLIASRVPTIFMMSQSFAQKKHIKCSIRGT
ncbi:hypothetical protein OROGR_030758 [Orobanche gracilis]